jgi:putative salt-induced outer membrane protein YdiY
MMKRHLNALCFVFPLFLLTVTPALADEVHLKNGDRISGKIIRMQDDKLVVKTDYAGEISLAWDQVASVKADEKIKVVLGDGTTLEGQTVEIEEGKMELKTEKVEVPLSFNLAEVQAINPKAKPPVRITARANVGIIQESGNTDTENLRLDGSFVGRTDKSRFGVGGEINREKSDDVDTVKNWLAYANYDYFFTQKWYWYVGTLLENDEFADLDLRSTIGTGIGYQIFETDTLNLSVSAGPAYVDENFIVADDNSYAAGQWNIHYDQYFFDKFLQLFHNQAGYVSVDDSDDWFVKTRQGVRFPLYRGLTGTLQYNYDYDHNPSPGAKENYDSKFMFLLGYEFKN